jgi:hypothetical protein
MISSAIGVMLATPNRHGPLASGSLCVSVDASGIRYGKIAGIPDPADPASLPRADLSRECYAAVHHAIARRFGGPARPAGAPAVCGIDQTHDRPDVS